MYSFEKNRILEWLRSEKVEKVLLQLPDGIKPYIRELVDFLENKGFSVYVSGSHTWGGCDIAFNEAIDMGINHIIHIGHHGPVRISDFRGIKVLFIPGYYRIDVERASSLLLNFIKDRYKKIGLFTTIQHYKDFKKIQYHLEEYGVKVYTGKSPDPFLPKGVIIGCDPRAVDNLEEDVDVIFVIAGGIFHALGIGIWNNEKKVLSLDPYILKIIDITSEIRKILSLRLNNIVNAMEKNDFVIVISTKPGQFFFSQAKRIEKMLKKKNKRVLKIITDEIKKEIFINIKGYNYAFVNCACPRLGIDEPSIFPGPIVNIGEVKYVLGLANVENYMLKDSLALSI